MNNLKRDRSIVDRVRPDISGKSLTQQQFQAESDINNITQRYIPGTPIGGMPNGRQPMFGDFSSLDFQRMQNAVVDIEQQFASLSARLRKRFNNDPYQLIRFVENPANEAECRKLGLLPGTADMSDPFVDDNQEDLVKQAVKADEEANPTFKAAVKPPATPPASSSPSTT